MRMQDLRVRATPAIASGLALAIAIACPAPASSQSPNTANTLSLDPGGPVPAALASDVTWLVGHWRGLGLGGTADEVWIAPEGGALAGLFRAVQADRVLFYEAMTIAEDGGTLVLRLKHFNADLTGWEEKDEVQSFPLVRIEPGAVFFDGLTYRLEGVDQLRAYVAVRQEDGRIEELEFLFSRIDP